MTEVNVLQIAGGNSLKNKPSLLLNGAGSSMQNPILRGLGMDVNIVLTPNIVFNEVTFGDTTPPTSSSILVFTQIGLNQYRHRGAIGYGTLGVDRVYTTAIQHFLREVYTANTGQVMGTERTCWVQEDPKIEFAFSSAQGVWCGLISEQFYTNDAGDTYGLTSNPGVAPAIGMWPDPENPVGWIEGGPAKVMEFGLWDAEQLYPVDLPVRLMEPWKNEFNEYKYGGAKYVSVFEEGGPEDLQGAYITNQYQVEIEQFSNVSILVADNDHEYRIVFRFRSELNDAYYVDKLVRFRLLTQDHINRQFINDLLEVNMPNIIYDETGGAFYWDGMTAAVVSKGFTSATVIVDDSAVSLPLNDVDVFPADWADLRSVLYGGEVPIRFQRSSGVAGTIEDSYETYRIVRPNGTGNLPIYVEKALFRRHIHSNDVSHVPETQFRFIEPTAPGSVYLEAINNEISYKQVVAWTELGSLSLEVPLRNGRQYDVTSILNVDPITGDIQECCLNLLLQTENTSRIVQVEPTTPRSRIRARYPGTGTCPDNVTPVCSPAYPDAVINWPNTTDNGESYTILGGDLAHIGNAAAAVIWGRKQAWRFTGMTPGSVSNLVGILGNVVYPQNSRYFLNFRVKITSGAYSGTIIDNVLETPLWLGYTGSLPTGAHPGDVQLIFYERSIVVVSKPSDCYRIQIIGNLGNEWYGAVNLVEESWYDISHLVSAIPPASITINYETRSSGGVITPYGPYVIPRFQPITTTPVQEHAVPGNVWCTSRLNNSEQTLPQIKVSFIDQTITFNYTSNFTDWMRWSVTNPLDKQRLIFEGAPPNLLAHDISRLFRSDSPYDLKPNQCLLVTLLQRDGPHICGLVPITGDYELPLQMDNLRGLM